ncbi:DUF2608 domain-containing protein [Methylomonas methanica]|uniref:Uncharacterized protein n=1 Tax=Methylomonas methanica (strain DSM 25384 / MC09) TaxID=857087 RepID=G0A792_METMM|nr:DUF2608 domain-containing protein [Methylomonas methanica]AEF99385.1 hypothetical protein Metme_0947 [Methylomonas methanica MC09]
MKSNNKLYRALTVSVLAMALAACSARQTVNDQGLSHSIVSEIVPSKNLSDVGNYLAPEFGRTLVVFDIDDTLLTSDRFFGSDHWYRWQSTLDSSDPSYVPCKFDVNAINYETETFKKTEAHSDDTVNSLGADKLFLTARSPYSRGPTLRELKNAGYALPLPLNGDPNGLMYRWQVKPDAAELPVSYADGVFMVSGRNKGLLLLDLLAKLKLDYDHVILIDDSAGNIAAMRDALKAAGINYHGLHYTRIEKQQPPDQGLIAEANAAWQGLQNYLAQNFPRRLEQLRQNQCFY